MKLKERIILATPIISLMLFLACGYAFGHWKPAALMFLLIPVMPVILYSKWYKNIFPTAIVTIYIIVSLITGLWHPLWVMLLLIPIYYIIAGPYYIRERRFAYNK